MYNLNNFKGSNKLKKFWYSRWGWRGRLTSVNHEQEKARRETNELLNKFVRRDNEMN